MKTLLCGTLALFVLAGVLLLEGPLSGGEPAPKVRQPAVAGSFYPAGPKELGMMLDDFLSKAA